MYVISKQFHFSASHVLEGLPEGHPCGRLHGHNYIVELVLAANQLDATGFVQDYGELNEFKRWLDNTLDHRHLNDIVPFSDGMNPSAENLARWLFDVWTPTYPLLRAVRVSETPKTWAVWEGIPLL